MSIRNAWLSTAIAASLLLLLGASGAQAQESADQQACLNALNKNGAAVAKVQGQENISCVKAFQTGKTGTATGCSTADLKGKVGKAKAKTSAAQAKSCGTAPDFGFTGATTVNSAAVTSKVNLLKDVFGSNTDSALINCTTNKIGCTCQQKVLKSIELLAAVKFSEFLKCKKATLKGGATSATALADCVNNAGTEGSLAADSGGKIAKAVTNLTNAIIKSCDTPGVTGAFPGDCTGTGGTLGTCLDQQVECRVCLALNQMDNLTVDCDLFDDGTANSTCLPPPPPTIVGALPPTLGRFNYNMTLGLPGANAACNSNFSGSHVCSYQELQTAETNGQLVGLQDTNNNNVASFWVIDSTAPALQQCQDDNVGGSLLNWEYGTAHTASRGRRVTLDNGMGTLGPVQTSVQCNLAGSSSVGCCQ
jgi:hypothetical protein